MELNRWLHARAFLVLDVVAKLPGQTAIQIHRALVDKVPKSLLKTFLNSTPATTCGSLRALVDMDLVRKEKKEIYEGGKNRERHTYTVTETGLIKFRDIHAELNKKRLAAENKTCVPAPAAV
jgi:predicted transcriptional regulator